MTSIFAASIHGSSGQTSHYQQVRNSSKTHEDGEFLSSTSNETELGQQGNRSGLPSTQKLPVQSEFVQSLDAVNRKDFSAYELSDDVLQDIIEQDTQSLERMHKGLQYMYARHVFPEQPTSGHPGNDAYGKIVVGGQVVAEISNEGTVKMDGPMPVELREQLIGSVNHTNGPNLAEARAEQLAKFFGGRIEKSETALTQAQFEQLEPPKGPELVFDTEAMKQDPLFSELQGRYERLENLRERYFAQTGERIGVTV